MADKILIVGSGAMATLFAARLSASGVLVKMIGSWQEGLTALARHGAVLVNQQGDQHAYPVQILESSSKPEKLLHALVLVKSWQTTRVASQLPALLHQQGLVLTLQNGLGNRDILAEFLGTDRVAQGVTTLGGTLLGPGRVQQVGEGELALEAHPKLEPLTELLIGAGFQIKFVSDSESLIWGKLVINSAINPLSALLRLTNGELLEHPTRRLLLADLVRESAAVATANGIRLPYSDPVIAAEDVARRTSSNRSSMLQDVERGAPTEIDAISGAIVALGKSLGVPTPYNASMVRLVQAINPTSPL
ncbi:MAG: 2-dehydropantoate 2-reductase [Chloroflexota bacterium]